MLRLWRNLPLRQRCLDLDMVLMVVEMVLMVVDMVVMVVDMVMVVEMVLAEVFADVKVVPAHVMNIRNALVMETDYPKVHKLNEKRAVCPLWHTALCFIVGSAAVTVEFLPEVACFVDT